MISLNIKTTLFVIFLLIFTFGFSVPVFSQTTNKVDDLKTKIEERNNQIKKIEEEIQQYNQEVIKTTTEAKTLQNTLKTLDLTDKKLQKDLTLTQTKIVKTNLTLEETQNNINQTQKQIEVNSEAIKESLKNLQEKETVSLVETVLAYQKFTDVWGAMDNITRFQNEIKNQSDKLRDLKTELNVKKKTYENEKNKLGVLKTDLSDQKKVVEGNKKEKSTLLVQTKNKEATYKEILKQKEAQKQAFEKELFEFESQLRYEIDPSKYPGGKAGILDWPLDKVLITQNFGKTNASARLYVSGSHNGVDFSASVGTPVKASLKGVVWGTGNTDAYPGCYSFGKWVMIKHPNGLSTIYAHLSLVKVNQGQEVSTGDVIGLSGNTGYSTGPHLHLGVYATQGVRIEKYTSSRGCKEAVMPLADVRAYLDPIMYLPN